MAATEPHEITFEEIELLSFVRQNIIHHICEEAERQGLSKRGTRVIQVVVAYFNRGPAPHHIFNHLVWHLAHTIWRWVVHVTPQMSTNHRNVQIFWTLCFASEFWWKTGQKSSLPIIFSSWFACILVYFLLIVVISFLFKSKRKTKYNKHLWNIPPLLGRRNRSRRRMRRELPRNSESRTFVTVEFLLFLFNSPTLLKPE